MAFCKVGCTKFAVEYHFQSRQKLNKNTIAVNDLISAMKAYNLTGNKIHWSLPVLASSEGISRWNSPFSGPWGCSEDLGSQRIAERECNRLVYDYCGFFKEKDGFLFQFDNDSVIYKIIFKNYNCTSWSLFQRRYCKLELDWGRRWMNATIVKRSKIMKVFRAETHQHNVYNIKRQELKT